MKIYTKTGDKGETDLLRGIRVSKNHLAINSCGAIDEVNSFLGLVRCHPIRTDLSEALFQIQNDLFALGSRIAACLESVEKPAKVAELGTENVTQLETWIDQFETELEPLTSFILPSGCRAGCELHLARTICRRSERMLVGLIEWKRGYDSKSEAPNERQFDLELVYLNRLSDLLFVMARLVNKLASQPETPWLP